MAKRFMACLRTHTYCRSLTGNHMRHGDLLQNMRRHTSARINTASRSDLTGIIVSSDKGSSEEGIPRGVIAVQKIINMPFFHLCPLQNTTLRALMLLMLM